MPFSIKETVRGSGKCKPWSKGKFPSSIGQNGNPLRIDKVGKKTFLVLSPDTLRDEFRQCRKITGSHVLGLKLIANHTNSRNYIQASLSL